jgi:hypothetical protein
MKAVLSAIARRTLLRPVRPEREHVVRRAITMTPNRGAEVIVEPRGTTAEPASGEPATIAA